MDKLLLMGFLFGPALLGAQENTSELVGTWELESVEGFQARDGSLRANGRDIVFADGRRPFMGTFGTGNP